MIRRYERLNTLFRKFGVRLLRDDHHSDLVSSLRWIQRTYGLEVHTLLDVGAHDGSWSRSFVSSFPDTKPYPVEANSIHVPGLEATGLPHYIAAVPIEKAPASFTAWEGRGIHSLLRKLPFTGMSHRPAFKPSLLMIY